MLYGSVRDWPAAEPLRRRASAARRGAYVADRALPGQAYACFLRSPHAHTAIETIELENARKADGVISILECEMPATPLRVWQAINQQRRQAHA
jgi:CO/xanthine dehydrogenase Mo-binding subunit